jgi:CheY-like chemotaxis protein
MELASFPTDVREIADDVLALLQLKANQKGVRLTAQYAIEPDLCVMIDPQRLRQLLLNLIGNAVKFTDTGSVTLTMSYDEATDPGLLRCEVADTGCGIPRDRKDDLFQRFSQIDGSTTRNHGGTGLGLAICKGIVQMMEGHIGVYSDAGEGATFWFEVPADRIAAPQTQRTVFSQPDEGHRARVLAVDDNEDTRDLLRNALPREVADLTLAESGEQALAFAAQMPFDLILMDIQMSGMDGIATMRAIKDAGGPNAGCPTVAFTAMAAGERLAQLVSEGFDGTLSKPLVLNDLLACVRRYTTPGGIAIEPKARDAA